MRYAGVPGTISDSRVSDKRRTRVCPLSISRFYQHLTRPATRREETGCMCGSRRADSPVPLHHHIPEAINSTATATAPPARSRRCRTLRCASIGRVRPPFCLSFVAAIQLSYHLCRRSVHPAHLADRGRAQQWSCALPVRLCLWTEFFGARSRRYAAATSGWSVKGQGRFAEIAERTAAEGGSPPIARYATDDVHSCADRLPYSP